MSSLLRWNTVLYLSLQKNSMSPLRSPENSSDTGNLKAILTSTTEPSDSFFLSMEEEVYQSQRDYLHYENAVIGTVLTTLHASSVIITIFPNYNVSLRDPTISHRLKVQVQITGADQVAKALSATLHYQFIYRLQDHAINLSLPTSNDGALFVMANHQEETLSIVQIPRNISREQSTETTFRRSVDGTVRTLFKKPDEVSGRSYASIFQSMMIQPVVKEGKIPIWGVLPDGKSIFTDKINGHFIWDVAPKECDPNCDCCNDYDDFSDDDGDNPSDEDKDRPCQPPSPPQTRADPKNRPWTGLHRQEKPEPDWMYKRGLEILREEGLLPLRSPIKGQEFPSFERKIDPVTKITTKPNISSSEIGPNGRSKPLSQVEEVPNWKTENAKVQNSILKKIDEKMEKISSRLERFDEKLDILSNKMKRYYHQLTANISHLEGEWKNTRFGEASNAKEREI
ncbi:hypothetical protein CR513_30350, partial [Mucuna pruriens]